MKRIDGGFGSIFFKAKYNEHPRNVVVDQAIGSFQPLVSMFNDAQKSFKPYKSKHEAFRDSLQLFRGIANIVRGLGICLAAVILPFFHLPYAVYKAKTGKEKKSFTLIIRPLANVLISPPTWFIYGALNIIRGSTQILAAPLVWIFKMPLRGLLTLIRGRPEFTENDSIKRIVALTPPDSRNPKLDKDDWIFNTVNHLGMKVDKAILHKEKVPKNIRQFEKKAREQLLTHRTHRGYVEYIKLFKPKDIEEEGSSEEETSSYEYKNN